MGRGKLVFKGEEKAKKKKSRSVKKKSDGETHSNLSAAFVGGGVADSSSGTTEKLVAAVAPAPNGSAPVIGNHQTGDPDEVAQNQCPKVKSGQGLITTSQSVCRGHGTAFKTELRAGDAIIARTIGGGEEMRVVTMVLSPVSISLSSAFSSDLSTPTPFSYISKPRDEKKERAAKAAKARREQTEVEERAMGSYGAKGEIIYREKTAHGGYRIRKEKATTEMTRSDLLSVRQKKKSDRYC